jgi:uncharacterized protein YbjQ (UPF0145 family)
MDEVVPMWVVWTIVPIVVTFAFPVISWALGRWYQDSLLNKLDIAEKNQMAAFGTDQMSSTSNKVSSLSAQSSVLLHTSIVVGPSMGQMFFMWLKSIFGGRLHSYDVVTSYGRREVVRRLQEQATQLGCSSITNLRIQTSTVSFAKNSESKTSSLEFLAYGTGIRK